MFMTLNTAMKVLVTGGSGYLGRSVRQYFNADDLSRNSGVDILEPELLDMIGSYDLVIHLAAELDRRPDNYKKCFQTNVQGTINILEKVSEGSTFIYMSTKDIYGRFADKYRLVDESCETDYAGQSAYEWSKFIGERYVEYYASQRGFRAAVFRASNVYAPFASRFTGIIGGLVRAINFGEAITLPA